MDETLERLDGAAERILGGLAPLVAERAHADSIPATHRARYAAAVEMGWAAAESMPDGMERDADDDRAVVLICRDGTGIAGSARLVVPVPGRPLPPERDFDLRARDGATDLGRLVIGPEHRGVRSPLVIIGLFARAWLETRALGLRRIVASAPSELIELYRTLGVRLTELGPPRRHWGAERVPVELAGVEDRPAFADGPARRRPTGPRSACWRRWTRWAASSRPSAGSRASRASRSRRSPPARPASARAIRRWPTCRSRASPWSRGAPSPACRCWARRSPSVSSGRLAIHFLPQGGARLDDPASFASGRPVAIFEGTFQNDLALDSPDNASTSLLADLSQRSARAFVLSGRRHRLGDAAAI